MNAVTTQLTPVERYRQQVLPPDKARDLFSSLPAHIRPEVFERNLLNALMQNPALIEFPPALVYREVSKAAGLGLLLDPQLGEAYIVVAYNYKTKRQEPQLRIGYRGMLKLARQAGDVETIYAHEVCANDHIECRLGTEKTLVHRPDIFGDRGQVIGYYAVIKFDGGAFDFEPMSVPQIHAIRDRAEAWKAFQEKKIRSTPWSTDEGEMSKKTVLRRLMKRQPQSGDLAEAIRIEDEAENVVVRRVPDDGEQPPAPPAIEHQPQEQVGEVVYENERERSAMPADFGPDPPPPTAPDDGIPAQFDRRTTKPAQQQAAQFDGKAWLNDLNGALSGCEDMQQLEDQQKKVMLPGRGKASKEDWDKAEWLVHQAFKRINDANVLNAG